MKLGRWYVTFWPGDRAIIVEWRRNNHGLTFFGTVPGKPSIRRFRIGPLTVDRYRPTAP